MEDDPKRKLFFELQQKANIIDEDIITCQEKIKNSKSLISKLIPRLDVRKRI